MESRIFHGDLTPDEVARALVARFNSGSLRAQQFGSGDKIVVQVATYEWASSGGRTALTINLHKVADGLAVEIGQQAWLGVAASLGTTVLTAWRNPWSLLSRLDDLAQDIEHLQLSERVWEAVESEARAAGASFELSERLRRVMCLYCSTANPVGESGCISCGAPLGEAQPGTCPNCGFVIRGTESICPNCGRSLK